MGKTYTSDYIKIYIWQGISTSLGLLSLFIVTPKLTSIPVLFGIYSICISTTFFLTYADIGFMGAGYKYTSECFAAKDLKQEIEVVGFVSFILFIFAIIFSLIILIFAINPQFLIKNLSNSQNITIASKLLFILAFFSPVIVLQRLCQIVFGIRLKDYIYQRLNIIMNLIRITSILYFFKGTQYDIVGYFLFYQVVGAIFNVAYLFIIKRRYNYDLGLLKQSFKFSWKVFDKTKNLAFTTFFATILFILYFEIDIFVIGKMLGAESAAFYGVGLTIMIFLRNIYGIIYGPFYARFNHFVGLKDEGGLRNIYYNLLIIMVPIALFPIISLVILMRPFILCWVGNNYIASIVLSQFLILSYIGNFVSQPTGTLLVAQERTKWILIIHSIAFSVYWGGVFLTISSLGVVSFALFKFVTLAVSSVIYFMLAANFLRSKAQRLFKKIFIPLIAPLLFLFISLHYIVHFMPLVKSKINLLVVISAGGLASFLALCLYYATSVLFRDYVSGIFNRYQKRFV